MSWMSIKSKSTTEAINIIFDGPPGPESGRFVEVETDGGYGVNAGEWIERTDGLWALRITDLPKAHESEFRRRIKTGYRIASILWAFAAGAAFVIAIECAGDGEPYWYPALMCPLALIMAIVTQDRNQSRKP